MKHPMKPVKVTDLDDLRWPLLATPKIDGIRCLKHEGRALTASFKPIPNDYIRDLIERHAFEGWDGELTTPQGTFQATTRAVMTKKGEPAFSWHVFDSIHENDYRVRTDRLKREVAIKKLPWVTAILPICLYGERCYLEYEKQMLDLGYEGVCLRSLGSYYKWGRSTLREHGLIAVKRFVDSEATVVGFTELYSNQNEAFTGECGQTKRSHMKNGLVPMGTLGALVANDPLFEPLFKVGSGFTQDQRDEIWGTQSTYLNKPFKYKYLPHGIKDAPRHPIFLGWRDPKDLTTGHLLRKGHDEHVMK